MHKMTLISLKTEEPSSEGELAPINEGLSNAARHGFNPAPWPRTFTEATYNERDESRPLTPPSPINPRDVPPQEAPNSIEKPGTGIKLDNGTPSKTKTRMS